LPEWRPGRLGKTQAKEIAGCVRAGGKGDLGALPLTNQLETCFLADGKNRVFTMKQRSLGKEQSKCQVNFLPTFAVPDIGPAAYNVVTNNYSAVVNLTAVKRADGDCPRPRRLPGRPP
jgi:hypothetical protein